MRMQKTLLGAGGLALSLLASGVMAQSLTQSEIDSLGTTLTPIGAEKAGNTAGSIPDWSGGLVNDAGKQLENKLLEQRSGMSSPSACLRRRNSSNTSKT